MITLAESHNSMFRDEQREKKKSDIVLHHIFDREIDKMRKANVGIQELSDQILITKPDFVVIPT